MLSLHLLQPTVDWMSKSIMAVSEDRGPRRDASAESEEEEEAQGWNEGWRLSIVIANAIVLRQVLIFNKLFLSIKCEIWIRRPLHWLDIQGDTIIPLGPKSKLLEICLSQFKWWLCNHPDYCPGDMQSRRLMGIISLLRRGAPKNKCN